MHFSLTTVVSQPRFTIPFANETYMCSFLSKMNSFGMMAALSLSIAWINFHSSAR